MSSSSCLSETREWHQLLPLLEKYQELSHLEQAKIHLLPTPKNQQKISYVFVCLHVHRFGRKKKKKEKSEKNDI
jgi:hypothetical protein